MISSEMPEILGMCDRIFVMCNGRVSGCLDRAEADQEKILHLAMLTGGEKEEEAS
jgi:rhamnose transport system ATP-binding protein